MKKEWTHETAPINKNWMGRNGEINVRSWCTWERWNKIDKRRMKESEQGKKWNDESNKRKTGLIRSHAVSGTAVQLLLDVQTLVQLWRAQSACGCNQRLPSCHPCRRHVDKAAAMYSELFRGFHQTLQQNARKIPQFLQRCKKYHQSILFRDVTHRSIPQERCAQLHHIVVQFSSYYYY